MPPPASSAGYHLTQRRKAAEEHREWRIDDIAGARYDPAKVGLRENMDYLLAFDVGTTGTKAVLTTTAGGVVDTAFAPYPTRYPRPLWAEQDPADWWRAVGRAAHHVLARQDTGPRQVLAVAFSGQMINIVALDARNEVMGPAISWLDGRAGAEARQVMRRLGGEKIFAALLGATITGKDLLPKYLWLKRHAPDLYRRTAAFVDCNGYLLLRATGQLAYEWTHASVTGFFNLKSKRWDPWIMRYMGVEPAKFPPLVRPIDRVGGLTDEAATHLGLLAGTPVFAGAGDALVAAVGAGASGDGQGHLCLGTSGFYGIITGKRQTGRNGVATLQAADPDRLLLIGASETSAACLKWAARELYRADENDGAVYRQMDLDVQESPPGAHGLLFLPWLYGERCPIADERLRAGFLNLGANHTRNDMIRAVYEGVACNFRLIMELTAQDHHLAPDPLRALGGGARGLPWIQIFAEVTGRTFEVVANPHHAGAAGAALLAAVGLGIYPSVEAAGRVIPVEHVLAPTGAGRDAYERLYAAFRQAYPALRRLYVTLNRPAEE
jgi:xylulokinase